MNDASDVAALPACDTLQDGFAALLSAHLQTVADLASLRYEVARLAGATPSAAAALAADEQRLRPPLAILASHGLDVDRFVSDLSASLRARAAREGMPS